MANRGQRKACVDEIISATGLSHKDANELFDIIETKRKRVKGTPDQAAKELAKYAKDTSLVMKSEAARDKRNAAMDILTLQDMRLAAKRFLEDTKSKKNPSGDYKEAALSILYGSHKQAFGARESAAARQMAVFEEFMDAGIMARIMKEAPHVVKLLSNDKGFLDNVVREMYEVHETGKHGITGDNDAKFVARLFHDAAEAGRLRANRAGAFIDKLSGWAPQSWDAGKVFKADKATFISKMLNEIDILKSFSTDNSDEAAGILDKIYDNIIYQKQPEPDTYKAGPWNLAKKFERQRVLYFKDADAYIRMHDEFGRGNIMTAMIGHLQSISNRIGLMEKLGTNPELQYQKYLNALNKDIETNPDLTKEQKKKAKDSIATDLGGRSGKIGTAFKVVMGEDRVVSPEGLSLSEKAMAIRAWQTLTKLGKVLLASFNDVLTHTMAAHYRGKNVFESYLDAAGDILQGPLTPEKRHRAFLMGVGADNILHSMMSRQDAMDAPAGKWASRLDTFFKLTGLTGWTDRLRTGFVHTASADMAYRAGTDFASLDAPYKKVLEFHGIGESEWNIIRKAVTRADDGVDYIFPETIDGMGLELKKRDDIKAKLMGYFIDETNHAIIIPGARERAEMLQGTHPGTALGETLRFFMQFKAFPWAYQQKFLWEKRFMKAGSSFREPDLNGIANLIAGSLVLGYISMSAKDFVSGKSPRDPRKWETWLSSALQGGGAGIYGDFLFGKYSRFGGGVLETLAGPTLGTAADIARMGSGLMHGEFKAGDAFNTALNNTPYINLWYTRAALDYAILYRVQEMLSPGVLERRERRIKDEYNQEYLVEPSQVIPYGGK